MTPEAQRIAIAEACGWHPDAIEHVYLNDLNAMHEAEKVLTDEQWINYSFLLMPKAKLRGEQFRGAIHATAAQRAEAFLRTLGLWEE